VIVTWLNVSSPAFLSGITAPTTTSGSSSSSSHRNSISTTHVVGADDGAGFTDIMLTAFDVPPASYAAATVTLA
jgi:hypothetical protein